MVQRRFKEWEGKGKELLSFIESLICGDYSAQPSTLIFQTSFPFYEILYEDKHNALHRVGIPQTC